jgi:hypothetical protein
MAYGKGVRAEMEGFYFYKKRALETVQDQGSFFNN